ncbi:MAG: hypothetical protein PVJ71_04895, partial [Lysobacterales bacterium]
MSFFSELKRRNVIRIAVGYAVAGWVVVEVASILLPTFDAPDWAMRAVVLALIGGLPVAMVFSWMFEFTPDGLKKEDGTDTHEERLFKARTDRKADLTIMAVLALVVAYFIFEKIWLSDAVQGG